MKTLWCDEAKPIEWYDNGYTLWEWKWTAKGIGYVVTGHGERKLYRRKSDAKRAILRKFPNAKKI